MRLQLRYNSDQQSFLADARRKCTNVIEIQTMLEQERGQSSDLVQEASFEFLLRSPENKDQESFSLPRRQMEEST